MSYEWIIMVVLGIGLVMSLLRRLFWLAILAGVIALIIHLGLMGYLIDFVKQTLIHSPSLRISIG